MRFDLPDSQTFERIRDAMEQSVDETICRVTEYVGVRQRDVSGVAFVKREGDNDVDSVTFVVQSQILRLPVSDLTSEGRTLVETFISLPTE
jgi:hypothetical protein